MRASALPQAGLVQTDLQYPPGNFDRIYRFENNAYVQSTFDPDDGWTPSQPTLQVGEGAFFNNANATKNWIRNFTVGP
jgi:hypothetical protein